MKIRQYDSESCGKTLVLVDEMGMPQHFPNRYTFSTIEKRGGSNSSVEKALYVIARIYLWADINNLSVEENLYYGKFWTSDQISDLVDFLQYTSETQNQIALFQNRGASYSDVAEKIIVFKHNEQINYRYTSHLVYASRLRALQKYFDWIIVERRAQRIPTCIETLERVEIGRSVISNSIPRVKAKNEDEQLEAVDLETTNKIIELLHPEHADNPFRNDFLRQRNYLLILLLIESGGRRDEIYHTTSKDIISGTLQYDIKVSKTIPRTVPISQAVVDAFEAYHVHHWRNLKGNGKRQGYLFLKSNGERLSLRSINFIIETIRKKLPAVPNWFHTHTIRRTYNHRLSILIDSARKNGHQISHEEERNIRN